jgi:putative PEP-CTERM system TPR-repeat lipoprotein
MDCRLWLPRLTIPALFAASLAACSGGDGDKQQLYERGNALFEQGKYTEAIIQYRNALQVDPQFGAARLKLAEAYERGQDFSRASREYIRAADLLPTDENAQYQAARYLLLSGQFEDAATRARKVLDRNAGHVQAQIVLGNALVGMKDLSAGIKEIEEAVTLDPTRASSYTNLAALRVSEGKEAEAQQVLEKAVQMAPTSVTALLSLANFHWGLGRLEETERLYKRALDIQPDDSASNRGLALLYMSTKRAALAEPLLKAEVERTKSPRAQLALADFYSIMKRPAEATAVLKALERDPASATVARIRLAVIAYDQRRTKEAHDIVDGVLKQDPKEVEALLTKGRWLLAERQLDAALATATAAVTADPRSIPAMYLLGVVREGRNELDDAAKAYSQVLARNPTLAAAQTRLARLQLARGAVDAGIEVAQDAIRNSPNSADARAALARGLIQKGQYAQAEGEIATLKKQYADNAAVLALEGHLLAAKNDLPGAERAFLRSLEKLRNYRDAVIGLVIVQAAQNRVGEATRRIESALASEPNNPALLMTAARVYVTAGNAPRAQAVLEKLVQVNPNELAAYGMLAQVYMAQRKTDQARTQFEEIGRRRPSSPVAPTMLGMIAELQGRRQDAEKHYRKALDLDANAYVAANNLAWLYADAGQNLDQALQLAKRASDAIAGSGETYDTLGWVHYKRQLSSLAIAAFEKSIATDPKNPAFRYHLGLALAQNGDKQKARESFQEALKLRANYPDAQKAIEELQ